MRDKPGSAIFDPGPFEVCATIGPKMRLTTTHCREVFAGPTHEMLVRVRPLPLRHGLIALGNAIMDAAQPC